MYGSKYDTPFWKAAGKLKIEDPLFDDLLTYSKKFFMTELLDVTIELNTKTYGQWLPWNFKYWHDGMLKE